MAWNRRPTFAVNHHLDSPQNRGLLSLVQHVWWIVTRSKCIFMVDVWAMLRFYMTVQVSSSTYVVALPVTTGSNIPTRIGTDNTE